MASLAPQAIERLMPAFHGQHARVIAYIALKGSATPDEVRRDLKIPRSSVYKILSQLTEVGLASKKKGKVDRISVPDFLFIVKNTTLLKELKVTPRNVLAFDTAHTPTGKIFIERHGPEKFARFVELYDEYARGRITVQMIARELGVIRYEVELLLSEIRSILPIDLKLETESRR